jgi:L-lactate dehydrogenase complex protein LldE
MSADSAEGSNESASPRTRVALFVTCLADLFRPQVAFAAAKLLEACGCDVEVPVQTCCGQPAYNGGDRKGAVALAKNVIAAFEPYEFVVAPSGSCAGMIAMHYPRLFDDNVAWKTRAEALAAKTHELFSFLVRVRGLQSVAAECRATAAYHDSCSSIREMGVGPEPRALLASVKGFHLRDLEEPQTCCGFGGFFSVKYPEVSAKMGADKIADARSQGAELIVGGDLGCLLHLAGLIARHGEKIAVRHAAEVLAGMGSEPAIGEDGA